MAPTRTPAPLANRPSAVAHELADLEDMLRRAGALLLDERALEAARFLDRWQSRSFVALVVSEFKRGKSTLLNALIGQGLLPTGVPPVTAVPTRVRSGPRTRAVARFGNGAETEIAVDRIRDYVDESRNPGNHQAVVSVDVELPNGPPPGVVLVDIPGLGSVHAHNTEAALGALPEADAALVVASVDPPVGEAELRLLRLVREHAARVDLVLNKIDYLDEAGRRAAEDFTRRTLEQQGFGDVCTWPVSARDGLRARASHDDLGWRRSGMEALSTSLDRFFQQERTAVLARSLARKAGRLVAQEQALLEMRRAATERSSRQLREIIEQFRSRLGTTERDSAEALLVFRRRFELLFEGYSERAAAAWSGPRAGCESRLSGILAARPTPSRGEAWKEMEAAARASANAFVDAFIPEEARRLGHAYSELCAEVAGASAERAEAVWRLAADLLPFEPPTVDPPPAAPAPQPAALQVGPLRLLLDDLQDAAARLLPRSAALRRLADQAREEAEARYGQAVEQSRETFSRAYEEHFRGLLAAFGEAWRRTAATIEAALAAAEDRARALETGRHDAAPFDTARSSRLQELRESLRQIGEGAQTRADDLRR
jgi:hypothetical protein